MSETQIGEGGQLLVSIVALAREMEDQLGLPRDLLLSLFQERDDWAFAVKTHAVVEAAASFQLTVAAGDVRLQPVFKRLELSNSSTGKLAFLAALELLDKQQRAFIRWFSELRNTLVHDVHNTRFTFSNHFAGLDKNQRRAACDALVGWADSASPQAREAWRERALSDTKFTLWFTTLMLVDSVYRHSLRDGLRQQLEAAKEMVLQAARRS